MAFLSEVPDISFEKPVFGVVLANTLLSTIPGVSGAGGSPEMSLMVPVLDAELVVTGAITSTSQKPDTPTNCPTPATICRSMMELTGLSPFFVNAGLVHTPAVPCIDVYGEAGRDPRFGEAVPDSRALFERGRYLGSMAGNYSDLLVLGECVPGGTTTALCVLRGLGYTARVSSSFIENPHTLKDEICDVVQERLLNSDVTHPLDVIRYAGDPMIAVTAGIAASYPGKMVLAGGTQMLAVAAVLARMGEKIPLIATTTYVREDASASFEATLKEIGAHACYVDPDFGSIGHAGLARYCMGEVKEGTGAGGALFLAYLMGHSPQAITERILDFVNSY